MYVVVTKFPPGDCVCVTGTKELRESLEHRISKAEKELDLLSLLIILYY